MRACFALAERGHGRVSPNPLVGAVLVKGGRIVSRGWHRRFGAPHAEVECLRAYKGSLRGATLYVNLEPCAHYGKTPPCADMLLAAGLRSVVVAMKDPNPVVAGRGITKLRQGGASVRVGVCEEEARRLNKFFVKHITTGIPYVHLKIAQSMDGYIGGENAPRWITSPPSLRLVHEWRARYDAVLIGAGTVAADDPSITVRHTKGRHPHVIILDGRLSLKDSSELLRMIHQRYVFLCVEASCAARAHARVRELEDRGIIILRFPGKRGRFAPGDVLREVYRYGVGSILVEGGSSVFAQFREAELDDETSIFVAPFMLGGGVPAFAGDARPGIRRRSATTIVRPVGRDILFQAVYH
jgi:diaminohydroxyphosphoribosylaminopyrimidine deaminase / 5-amino-6-(5-phosphoribosylamino)uracil reductase